GTGVAMALTITKELQVTLQMALDEARRRKHEYVTLEHLLRALLDDPIAKPILVACGADLVKLSKELVSYLNESIEAGARAREPGPPATARARNSPGRRARPGT